MDIKSSETVAQYSDDDQYSAYGLFRTFSSILIEVLFFWQLRLYTWWKQKPRKDALIDQLYNANTFEEWEAAAVQLDELLGNDLWRQNPTSKYFDYRLITTRLHALQTAYTSSDILSLISLLRSGLVRNLGNITTPRLFNRAYAGTKLSIEEYVTQVAYAIQYVANYPTSPAGPTRQNLGFTSQAKLDLLHDTRQAFGRTALVLQGGAIFGLCHIGVVRALHLRGVLPRIIVGAATGALVAALVGVHSDAELLNFLSGNGINLAAFAWRGKRRPVVNGAPDSVAKEDGWLRTLARRIKRYVKEGYFLDVKVLEECVRANIGDITFDEAYQRTKRVLNITIPVTGQGECPALLNYLTAPNVLIWSAAVVSNASSAPLYSPATLLCRSSTGEIVPWSSVPTSSPGVVKTSSFFLPPPRPAASSSTPTSSTTGGFDFRDSPHSRVAELFNVNHFVVSQARPSIAPLLQTGDIFSNSVPRHSSTRSRGFFFRPLLRIAVLELQHRLRQLDILGLLNESIRRFVLDEAVPGASLTIVPDLSASDFWDLLERPTKEHIDSWILRGERSVWPAVGALKVRCAIEVQLDRNYQMVRRRKPMGASSFTGLPMQLPAQEEPQEGPELGLRGTGGKRRRPRSGSLRIDSSNTRVAGPS